MLDLYQLVVKSAKGQREIIQKAEKQLLQDGVRCINAIIEDSGNNINKCRTRLASLVTNTTDIDECSKFIHRVREDRFFKARDRQVNKLNRLVSKGNNNSFSHNNQAQATGNNNSTNSYNNH